MSIVYFLVGLIVTIAFIMLPFMVYAIMGHVGRMRRIEEERFKLYLRNDSVRKSDIESLYRRKFITEAEAREIFKDRGEYGVFEPQR